MQIEKERDQEVKSDHEEFHGQIKEFEHYSEDRSH